MNERCDKLASKQAYRTKNKTDYWSCRNPAVPAADPDSDAAPTPPSKSGLLLQNQNAQNALREAISLQPRSTDNSTALIKNALSLLEQQAADLRDHTDPL